jgi:Protein of unknown function (DUF3147)
MSPWLLLALKVVLAGAFVALLAHVGSALKPKMFAGLFAGAPAVALFGLLLTGLENPEAARLGALSMAIGAVGMVACCAVASVLVPKLHAVLATAAGWVAWFLVAFALFAVLFR